MLILIIATLLLSLLAIAAILLLRKNKEHKMKFMEQFLNQFYRLGSRYDLQFNSIEILANTIFGLDTTRRKILILEKKKRNIFLTKLVSLDEVKHIAVRKQFGYIRPGGLKKRRLEFYLKEVNLQFVFAEKPAIEILFFHRRSHTIKDAIELERKASKWETMLSKLLLPEKKIA